MLGRRGECTAALTFYCPTPAELEGKEFNVLPPGIDYERRSKALGFYDTAKTVAEFNALRYTDPDRFALLEQYIADVESGKVSPGIGFAAYEQATGKIGETVEAGFSDGQLGVINIRSAETIQHGFAAFPFDDILAQRAPKIVPEEGFYDVAMHGEFGAVGFGSRKSNMTAKDLAKYILHRDDYRGEPIRLLSCETGKMQQDGGYCVAEELANALGVPVKAPDDLLFIYENGRFEVGIGGRTDLTLFLPNQRRRLK